MADMSFGDFHRAARQGSGIGMRAWARETGFSLTYVCRVENGEKPSPRYVRECTHMVTDPQLSAWAWWHAARIVPPQIEEFLMRGPGEMEMAAGLLGVRP